MDSCNLLIFLSGAIFCKSLQNCCKNNRIEHDLFRNLGFPSGPSSVSNRGKNWVDGNGGLTVEHFVAQKQKDTKKRSNLLCSANFLFSAERVVCSRRFNTMTLFNANAKKLIQIDISSDTVCPWCFVGRKNLGNAMDLAKDRFNFELRWHPFFLDPSAPKEGIKKSDHYKKKFGASYQRIESRMTEIFRGFGLEYDTCGLTGNTLDSHRLITFAGSRGYDKQDLLVQELFQNYFIDGKYINDRQVLIDAAQKVGIEGAAEFLEDPNKGLDEVNGELEKYSGNISGVPNYLINGKHRLHGGQPPEAFLRAFEYA